MERKSPSSSISNQEQNQKVSSYIDDMARQVIHVRPSQESFEMQSLPHQPLSSSSYSPDNIPPGHHEVFDFRGEKSTSSIAPLKLANDFGLPKSRNTSSSSSASNSSSRTPPPSTFRTLVYAWVNWIWFEIFIYLVIMFNIVLFALYDPTDGHHDRNHVIDQLQVVVLGVFIVEMLLKMYAYGLFTPMPGERTYLKDWWNYLDMIIVITGVLEIVSSYSSFAFVNFSVIRTFRAFRLFKLLEAFPSFFVVLVSIEETFNNMGLVFLFAIVGLCMFALLGAQLFRGQLHTGCYNTSANYQVQVRPCGSSLGAYHCDADLSCVKSYDAVQVSNGTTSYDHFGVSLLTTFVVMNSEGWTKIYSNFVDSNGSGWTWVYFLAVYVFGGYFILNLLKGVICSEFTAAQMRLTAHRRFRAKNLPHRTWIAQGSAFLEVRYSTVFTWYRNAVDWFFEPKTPEPTPLLALIESNFYSYSMLGLIFANAVFLGLDHYGQSQSFEDMLTVANYFFVGFFVVECLVELKARGFRLYFRSIPYTFDFIIVMLGLIEVLVSIGGSSTTGSITAFRVLRLMRVFKLTKQWKSFEKLQAGILKSTSALVALSALAFSFVLVFALLGMNFFGGNFFSRINFDSFRGALTTVFQIFTTEAWPDVLSEGVQTSGGIGTFVGGASSLFFVAAIVFGQYLVLNIFLAVAVSNITDELEGSDDDVLGQNHSPRGSSSSFDGLPTAGPLTIPEDSITKLGEPEPRSALYVFSGTNPLRLFLIDVINHKFFRVFVYSVIVASCICLAIEDPVNLDSHRNDVLLNFDRAFVAFFCFEFVIKVIAMGFIMHPGAYLRSGWGVLELVVVATSIAAVTTTDYRYTVLRALRILRLLRILRFVQISSKLHFLIASMLRTGKLILHLLVIGFLFLYCFAVMGVELFKGKFFYCNDSSKLFEYDCVGTFNSTTYDITPVTTEIPRVWLHHHFNFDNVGKGLELLFSVSNGESWTDYYFPMIDSTHQNEGPIANYSIHLGAFLIIYLIFSCFFFLNIVAAFIVVAYKKVAFRRYFESGFDETQCLCFQYVFEISPLRFYPALLKSRLFTLVNSVQFVSISYFLILLNFVCLIMEYEKMTDSYKRGLDVMNIIFTACFVVEILLRMAAYRVKYYFESHWDKFDFIIMVGSVIDAALNVPHGFNLLRAFRVARVYRLLRNAHMRKFVWTFWLSMQSAAYLVVVLLFLFYIYAVIGMELFGRVAIHDDQPINSHFNFRDFPHAMLLLFRVSTGEDWPSLMEYCHPKEGCNENDPNGSTCGSRWAVPFFFSFVLLCQILYLNLFVAIVLTNFNYLTEDPFKVFPFHMHIFTRIWSEFDPLGQGRIKYSLLEAFLRRMDPPLGIGAMCPRYVLHGTLRRLRIPIDDQGYVSFHTTLFEILRLRFGGKAIKAPHFRSIVNHVVPGVDYERLYSVLPDIHAETLTVSKLHTAKFLQELVRNKSTRRKEKAFQLSSLIAQHKFELSCLSSQIQSLQTENKAKDEKLSVAEGKNASLSEELNNLYSEHDALMQRVADLEDSLRLALVEVSKKL